MLKGLINLFERIPYEIFLRPQIIIKNLQKFMNATNNLLSKSNSQEMPKVNFIRQ